MNDLKQPALRRPTFFARAPARAALLALAWLCAAGGTHAQAYPDHPVRMVVPFPPAGAADLGARIVSEALAGVLKQPVVIDNRPGANTAIGAQAVARAEPDGYTLLAAMDSTLVMNPASATGPLGYDPFNDFSAVTLTAKNTSLLTVRAADGAATVTDLI
ncbi:MAG TPA: tripartite tricarboxylate transporter substrate-binding protein, partial [Burkholderiales bacterium]|nr:tripartite tricarboxylate transporter substrate-binding protein [Burkholderiales bacterium]